MYFSADCKIWLNENFLPLIFEKVVHWKKKYIFKKNKTKNIEKKAKENLEKKNKKVQFCDSKNMQLSEKKFWNFIGRICARKSKI